MRLIIRLCRFIIGAVSVVAVAGCTSENISERPDGIKMMSAVNFKGSSDQTLGEYIDGVSYIGLECGEGGEFREISKLYYSDGKYFIGDRSQAKICVFSDTGDFLYAVDYVGQGPEEYIEIANFTVTPSSIYVLDNYSHRILRYSAEDGTFLSSSQLSFTAWDLEAFDDNNFLFTLLENNPHAKINTEQDRYAVWRTDGEWNVTAQYLPVENGYYEMYGKRRYFTRSNDEIVFQYFRYNGYFVFRKDEEPYFRPVQFPDPVPLKKELDPMKELRSDYQYIAATPYLLSEYAAIEISHDGHAEQMLAVIPEELIVCNSHQTTHNMLLNVDGVAEGCFVACINDDFSMYEALVEHGFAKAGQEVEAILKDGGSCLILYAMKPRENG